MAGKSKKKMGWQNRVLLAIFFLAAIVFLPTTTLLFIGMLPTIVARLADRTKGRTRVLTVGFMNFAGCFPFVYKLFEQGHKFENALQIISQPSTVAIIYAAAGMGYLIESATVAIVSSFMVQRGKKRLDDIKKFQSELIARWGHEVTGEIPLDLDGFPIEQKNL